MPDSTQVIAATIIAALFGRIRDTIREYGVTYDEYAAAKQYVIEVGEAGEWPLFADVFFESAIEEVAFRDRPGSQGATEGPHYMRGAPGLTQPYVMPMRPGEPGDVLVLSGSVHSTGGTPLPGAQLDMWQGASDGTYSNIPYPDHRELPPPFNLRGRFTTDDHGRFEVRTIVPVPYEIPRAGPTGALLAACGWHAFRPAHLHAIVSAAGHQPLTSQLYFAGDPHLDSDVADAVKPSLVLSLEKNDDPAEQAARDLDRPFYTASYDFELAAV